MVVALVHPHQKLWVTILVSGARLMRRFLRRILVLETLTGLVRASTFPHLPECRSYSRSEQACERLPTQVHFGSISIDGRAWGL